MSIPLQKVIKYYDDNTSRKIDDYIYGNERIDKAWNTIKESVSCPPKNILEIGCGIGQFSNRMSQHWTNSNILGVDISPESISIAKKVFSNSSLAFEEGNIYSFNRDVKYDLIVMIDVYEHIEVSRREIVYKTISKLLNDNGKVFMTIPTPRHLNWLRENNPKEIQPVDNNIDIGLINLFSSKIGARVLFYKEIDVWHVGDYAHVIFAKNNIWEIDNYGTKIHYGYKIIRKLKSIYQYYFMKYHQKKRINNIKKIENIMK